MAWSQLEAVPLCQLPDPAPRLPTGLPEVAGTPQAVLSRVPPPLSGGATVNPDMGMMMACLPRAARRAAGSATVVTMFPAEAPHGAASGTALRPPGRLPTSLTARTPGFRFIPLVVAPQPPVPTSCLAHFGPLVGGLLLVVAMGLPV